MRFQLSILIALLGLVAVSPNAHARSLCFGVDESVVELLDVDLKSPKGDPLVLSYKVRKDCFFLPYNISDEGYVLSEKDGKTYYPLTEDQIDEYQKAGKLQIPLPEYKLSTLDYIFGYSLWILLGVIALWGLYDWLKSRRGDASDEAVDATKDDDPKP